MSVCIIGVPGVYSQGLTTAGACSAPSPFIVAPVGVLEIFVKGNLNVNNRSKLTKTSTVSKI